MADDDSNGRESNGLAYGATQIDGQPATSVVFDRKGESKDEQRFNLSFRMGRKSVANLKDLDETQLRDAVGDRNTQRILDNDKDRGSLRAEELSHEQGTSPIDRETQAAREGQQAGDRETDEQNSIERLDDREQTDEITSEEVRGRMARIRERNRDAKQVELNQLGDRADERRIDVENLSEQAEEQDAENDLAEQTGATTDRTGQALTEREKNREIQMMERLQGQFRVSGSNKYHFKEPGARVAFKDKGERIVSGSNDERVSKAMATMADARGWKNIKVSGHPDFRRDVWMEASLRGLEVRGYKPNERDVNELETRQEARMRNRVEQAAPEKEKNDEKRAERPQERQEQRGATKSADRDKDGAERDTGTQKAGIVGRVASAVIDSRFRNPQQREAVKLAMDERLAQRQRENRVPSVPVYDKSAPKRSRESERTTPQVERNSERTR